MKSKTKIVLFAVIVVGIASYAFVKYKKSRDKDPYEMFGIFAKVYNIIIARYVEPVDQNKLILGAFRGGVQSLNDNNSFIPADLMEKIQDRVNLKGTVGIRVIKRGNYAQVAYCNPESEAYKEGIKPGTIIRKINGMQAFNMSLFEINAMLHGKVGEKVAIDYYSSDLSKDIEKQFEYKEYKPADFLVEEMEGKKVFKLFEFSKNTFEGLKNYLEENKIPIIDLRYCVSDNYSSMADFAAYFKGKPVEVDEITKENSKKIVSKTKEKYNGNEVFVLVSGLTMNAADVFANLVKGSGHVVIIGAKTSGSAFDYQTFKLDSGDFVNIAVKKYAPLKEKGLLPDIKSFVDDDEVISAVDKYLREKKADGEKKKAA